MDKPFRELLCSKIEEADVILTGLPYDKGCSCGSGASKAPDMMRQLSAYLPPLTMDGKKIVPLKIYDNGNIDSCDNYYDVVENNTKEIFEINKFKLFLGGDHSVSIPLQKNFMNSAKKENKIPVIIHIDAHPDICDEYDGSTYSHACPNMRAIDHGFDTDNIILVGIRGYEEQEVDYFEKHPEIKVYNASYLNEHGFEDVLKYLKAKYQDEKYSIYLSYDIDANDPSFAPGTGTPEAFGLNSYELMKFIKEIIKCLPIDTMDIVEVSPLLDCNNITSWLALKTLYELFEIILKRRKK